MHTIQFWEEHYKEFEFNNFEYISKLVKIIQNKDKFSDYDIEVKSIACFDLGEFARLYPGGARYFWSNFSVIEHFQAKQSLLELIQHNNLELKNRALICLQKIMMRSLKKD